METRQFIDMNESIEKPIDLGGHWIGEVYIYDSRKDLIAYEMINFSEGLRIVVLYQLDSEQKICKKAIASYELDDDELMAFDSEKGGFCVKFKRNWLQTHQASKIIELTAFYEIDSLSMGFYLMKDLMEIYDANIIQSSLDMLLLEKRK